MLQTQRYPHTLIYDDGIGIDTALPHFSCTGVAKQTVFSAIRRDCGAVELMAGLGSIVNTKKLGFLNILSTPHLSHYFLHRDAIVLRFYHSPILHFAT
jgi:hypothetical protein